MLTSVRRYKTIALGLLKKEEEEEEEELERRRRRIRKKKNAKLHFVRCVRKLALYSDFIHLFDWKSAVEHDGGV